MSIRARITLAASVVFTASTIYFVHWNQENERETMYRGVVRDEERVAKKKAEREAEFRISMARREKYEAVQPIFRSGDGETS
ncbi:hypothetical protein DL93DRAFT_2166733 [Clavulina sp. PMI_390]|nr:hypothetical protein DL93DRAFT_2166733 [Clavulina sp. PMI_390]